MSALAASERLAKCITALFELVGEVGWVCQRSCVLFVQESAMGVAA